MIIRNKMKSPNNYRVVGYSIVLITISFVIIALLYVTIGNDVLYGDKIQREKTFEHEEYKNQLEFSKFLSKNFIILPKL